MCEREHNIGVKTKRKRKVKGRNQRFVTYRHRRPLWEVWIHSTTPFLPLCLTTHVFIFKYQCLALLLGLFSSGTLSSILNWYASVNPPIPCTSSVQFISLKYAFKIRDKMLQDFPCVIFLNLFLVLSSVQTIFVSGVLFFHTLLVFFY